MPISVIKKDGSRELFNKEKLVREGYQELAKKLHSQAGNYQFC